jgi:hypothetical protein
LAASALANNLASARDLSEAPPDRYLEMVKAARSKFDYLWEVSTAKVTVMRNLSILTLILSGLVLSYDVIRNPRQFQVQPKSELLDFAGGPELFLVTIVLGLGVSSLLYALSTLLASVLARRRAEWNLFVAKTAQEGKFTVRV